MVMIVQLLVDEWVAREAEIAGENLPQYCYPPQIPYNLTWIEPRTPQWEADD
jgi:hypothetical protein